MNWSWRAVPVVLFLALVAWGAWSVLDSVEAPVEAEWWHPGSGLAWQYQESGPVGVVPGIELYVLDAEIMTSADVASLQATGAGVLCGFEAGFVRPGTSPNVDLVPEESIGDEVDDQPGMRWLDIRDPEVLASYLEALLDDAVELGCDGVAPRSVDAWLHPTAFEFRGNDQLRYIRFIVDLAHERGLTYALHDNAEQAERLATDVDLFISTGCVTGGRCDLYAAAVERGVPVYAAETRASESRFCSVADQTGIEFIGKDPDFGPERTAC